MRNAGASPLLKAMGLLVTSALLGSFAGCNDDGGGTGAEGSGAAGPLGDVTFHKDVEPILHRSCLGCHLEGRIGGFSLEHYEDARSQAGLIAAVTASGYMPPWHAVETDDCQPPYDFVGDPRLSADEIAILRAWSDADAPEGDPADAPPAYVPIDLDLPDPDLELVPSEPFVVDGDADQFVCVVYDPALTEDRFLDGMHIVPGNPKVAHHALMFRVDRDVAAGLSGGNERYECFGAPAGDLINAWAPGQIPLQLPATVGMPLSPDQVIVVQMHYHPTGVAAEEDASTIQLRFMEDEPVWEYAVVLPGNESSAPGLLAGDNDAGAPEFRVPAGAEDHVERMVIAVPDVPIELPILVVGTHMHYVGVDIRLWIERATPSGDEPESECLVHTPIWDFNWQRGYMYDAPISALPTGSTGDTLHLECHYDNSMKNPFLAQALAEQGLSAPQEVTLGEETLDEMCLGAIGYLVPHF